MKHELIKYYYFHPAAESRVDRFRLFGLTFVHVNPHHGTNLEETTLTSHLSISKMDLLTSISSFYPSLAERRPLPTLYIPVAFSLTIIPFFIPSRSIGILTTFPLLVLLALSRPYFTSGDPLSDYATGGVLLGMTLWYLDFLILSPWTGEDVSFIGDGKSGRRITAKEPKPLLKQLIWALRLMVTPNRGIGWSWQVKGVPHDPDVGLSKWKYVRRRLLRGVVTFIRSLAALYVMGLATTVQEQRKGLWTWTALNVIIGWSGAIWAWNGINYMYNIASAVTVAIGLCGQWEWPPLTGSLSDAWSVRQMWRLVPSSISLYNMF